MHRYLAIENPCSVFVNTYPNPEMHQIAGKRNVKNYISVKKDTVVEQERLDYSIK